MKYPEHSPYSNETIAVNKPDGEVETFLIPADETAYTPVSTENLHSMETDMQRLMGGESIGGNAGAVEQDGEVLLCVGLNGYADIETGNIKALGNVQHVDPAIVEEGGEFSFKVAFSRRKLENKVVVVNIGDSNLTPAATRNLLLSAALYNEAAPRRAQESISQIRADYGSQVLRAMGYSGQ